MTFKEWLSAIPIRQTAKGARIDLHLYVYPDGHGNVCVEDETGKSPVGNQPVKNAAEALGVLEQLWGRAMDLREGAEPPMRKTESLADQFGDLIGSVPDLPEDMAQQHDHYVHGTPKQ